MFASWEVYKEWHLRPLIESLAAQEGFNDSHQLFEEWFYHPEGLTGTGWSTKALCDKWGPLLQYKPADDISELFPGYGQYHFSIQQYWAFHVGETTR